MDAERIRLRVGDALVSWRDVSYAILNRVGGGGSADVYLTLATGGARRGVLFAAKLFRAVSREGWQQNFMREVHVLRDCDHPSIMKVFDEGTYRDRYPFFLMEYLPDTLAHIIKDDLTTKYKFALVMHLLSAINYLSHRDPPAVHRDIKPQNIFLKEQACVLGDFGLIFQTDEAMRQAQARTSGGHVAEMAQMYRTPELVAYHNGGPIPPPRSDVFQLGLVAAELFTGKNPLKHASPRKTVELHAIPRVGGQMGQAINRLLDKMLILETDDRPTASQMLSQWQELYLALWKRETVKTRTAPTAEIDRPPPARPDPKEPSPFVSKPLPSPEPKPPQSEHKFGEGIFD